MTRRTATPGRPTAARRRRAACAVWWARPTAAGALLGILDTAERRTAARLARPADRDRYVTAHALVRLLLAERTGEPPTRLRFIRRCRRCGAGDHGRPRLAAPRTQRAASFNLAHAGSRVVVAVTHGDVDPGVDVERVPGDDAAVLGTAPANVLTSRERSALRQVPRPHRRWALALWWTRKEAALKAVGLGLAVPPSTVEVTPPWTAPAVTAWVEPPRRQAGVVPAWTAPGARPPVMALRDLDAGRGHVGCVAVRGARAIDLVERDAGALLAAA